MGEAGRRMAIIKGEMSMLIGAKSCHSCEFNLKTPDAPKVVMCRRYPPQVVTMPMPGPRGEASWGVNGFYPQVRPEWPCGEYKRNELNALEEIREAGGLS